MNTHCFNFNNFFYREEINKTANQLLITEDISQITRVDDASSEGAVKNVQLKIFSNSATKKTAIDRDIRDESTIRLPKLLLQARCIQI